MIKENEKKEREENAACLDCGHIMRAIDGYKTRLLDMVLQIYVVRIGASKGKAL